MRIIGRTNDEKFRYQIHEITAEFFKPESIEFYLKDETCRDRENCEEPDLSEFDSGKSGAEGFDPESADLIIEADIQTLENDFKFKVILKFKDAPKYENVCFMTDVPEFLNNGELPLINKGRRALKALLYDVYCKTTGKSLPWGNMTGVRPVKAVNILFKAGFSREEIFRELCEKYRVSRDKAKLVLSVAENQNEMLKSFDPEGISIYIGIPFCSTRCLYCSFTSNPIKKYGSKVDEYIRTLIEEMEMTAELLKNTAYKIKSVYIGGGTPTSVNAEQLDKLLKAVYQVWGYKFANGLPLESGNVFSEFCVEAGRPDSISAEKLEVLKNNKVTRICINPQTLNDETLDIIGRKHSADEFFKTFELSRKLGFSNINVDIIAGLPGENFEMFKNTLDKVIKLDPENITVHTMSLKRASDLNRDKGEYAMTPGEVMEKMISCAYERITFHGLKPFYMYRQKNMLGNLENVSYSREGFESYYNVHIMEEDQTVLAFGAGGVTKVVCGDRIERFFNIKDVDEYIKRKEETKDKKREFICRKWGN